MPNNASVSFVRHHQNPASLKCTAVATKQALNANTVTLISGTIGDTYARFGADLASAPDDGNKLRVLPIVGRGSVTTMSKLWPAPGWMNS
jgi:hypothetical protein